MSEQCVPPRQHSWRPRPGITCANLISIEQHVTKRVAKAGASGCTASCRANYHLLRLLFASAWTRKCQAGFGANCERRSSINSCFVFWRGSFDLFSFFCVDSMAMSFSHICSQLFPCTIPYLYGCESFPYVACYTMGFILFISRSIFHNSIRPFSH